MSLGVSRERYNIIISRYEEFVKNLDNMSQEPVRVFDPLTKKQLDELDLIRDVSQYLQNKKEEDIKKQAAVDEEKEKEELKEKEEAKEEEEVKEAEESVEKKEN